MADVLINEDHIQLVAFKLGKEEYGVSILQIQEIKRMVDITRVPHAPEFVEGVINLRGSVLPVIDLKKRLKLPRTDYTDHSRIVIAKIDDIVIGMIVDAVSEVLRMPVANIDNTPSLSGNSIEGNYISGVGKLEGRLVTLLNLETILGLSKDSSKAS